MLVKLYLLLFNSILLLQSSWGDEIRTEGTSILSTTPTPDGTSTSPPESIYESNLGPLNTDVNGFFPNLRLLILLAQDFYPLIFTALGRGQQLFENVIDDCNKTEYLTEELQIKLNDLSHFSAEIDKFSATRDFHCDKYIKMFEHFIHKLDSLNATTLDNPSHEDLLIDKALRKNSLKNLEQRFEHAFGSYLTVLSKQLETFEKLLVGKELALDMDVQDWIEEIKDMIKRIGSLVLYLEAQVAA